MRERRGLENVMAVQNGSLNSSMSSVKGIRKSSKNIRVMKDIIIMWLRQRQTKINAGNIIFGMFVICFIESFKLQFMFCLCPNMFFLFWTCCCSVHLTHACILHSMFAIFCYNNKEIDFCQSNKPNLSFFLNHICYCL